MKKGVIGKDPDAGQEWRQEEKGKTEDEIVGWHHQLDGHEFEQAPDVGDGWKPGMLQSMELQRARHHWATKLNCMPFKSTTERTGINIWLHKTLSPAIFPYILRFIATLTQLM